MKQIFGIIIFITLANIVYSQNEDPQKELFRQRYVINTQQNFIDDPVLTNLDLTTNNFPQNEPSVRILRTNPNIVVAAWRDFRLGYNPAIRRIGYAYSTNGGASWSAPLLLPAPQPNHATQSDPVLTSDANGNIFLTSTSREATNTRGETVVYRSTNNGVTFSEYSTAAASSSFEDKEWITCDLVPSSPYFNDLYITWTRIGIGIRCVKSTNGGLNWSSPVVVGDNSAGQGSNVAIGTNFFVYVVWGQSGGIKFDRSTNGGVSFGTDYQLSANANQLGFPFICVDYSNRATRGNIYVVWDDNRNGSYDAWFQRSTNAGVTWLPAPVRINDVTANDQYEPAIQCDTSGVLHVVYLDERTGAGQNNAYYAYSTNAGDTWINQRLSDSSFTLTSVNSDVRNGDYISIDAFNGKVFPIWTDDRRGTPDQEIFTVNNILLAAENNNEPVPKEFTLKQNYPNPFNPVTQIEYSVPKTGFINLTVFDILGESVKILEEGKKQAGRYSVSFDASNLPSGVYFYTLSSEGYRETKKMILIK